jgi:hypothetical protein
MRQLVVEQKMLNLMLFPIDRVPIAVVGLKKKTMLLHWSNIVIS